MSNNKTWLKRLITRYSIIFMVCVMAYIVRIASGQFDDYLNKILFYFSFILVSIAWETLRLFNALLDLYFPYTKSIPARIAIQLALGALFGITMRFFTYEFGEPYLNVKLDSMFLAATWLLYIIMSVFMNGIFITGFLVEQWKKSLVQAERLEKEKALVQFDNLKNQLNPHFLFNALTSLNSLIFDNQGLASQFLQHLSKVYRYVLQNKEKNFVSLETELDFIQNYVFLLRTRFEKAISINFKIDAASKEKAIVPVTLQILIENALKHNVVDKDKPLAIEIETCDDYLVVSNNFQARKLVETSNKQGLENLRSLYRFLTDHPVIVEQTAGKFSVKVPLI